LAGRSGLHQQPNAGGRRTCHLAEDLHDIADGMGAQRDLVIVPLSRSGDSDQPAGGPEIGGVAPRARLLDEFLKRCGRAFLRGQ
jgi:hypothetical protein